MNVDDAILNLNFRTGNADRGNESHKSIIIDCNIHYGNLDSATLKTKISEWKNRKDIIHSRLVAMLEEH